MSTKLITVYWRDIPAQVIAKRGRGSAKVQLSERFQVAIDRAAMRAGKGSSDKYLDDWRRESTPCSSDLEAGARNAAERLEAEFSDDELERVVKAGGVRAIAPDVGEGDESAPAAEAPLQSHSIENRGAAAAQAAAVDDSGLNTPLAVNSGALLGANSRLND